MNTPNPNSSPTGARPRRRRKLIDPKIQLRLACIFAGLAALAMVLQCLVFGLRLASVGAQMPDGGATLGELAPVVMRDTLLISFSFVLPVMVGVGVLVTFRIAGPLYRIKAYLRGIAAGTEHRPCKLRTGDHLQDLCDLVNEATAPLLTEQPSTKDAGQERRAA